MTKFLFFLTCIFLFANCQSKQVEKLSTPTTGVIEIICDEGLKDVISQEENVFERNYPNADVQLQYMNEKQMFELFFKDSTDIMITERALDSSELNFLKSKLHNPIHYAIGTTAMACIAGNEFPDTAITYEQLMTSLFDEATEKIQSIVLENTNSGIPISLLKMHAKNNFNKKVYAKNTKEEIIEYLNQNNNAIGIIDWSSISDSDNAAAQKLLSNIKLVGISRPIDSIQHGFILPYQYNLQDKIYPLTRDIFVISKSGRSDLGLGFAAFIAGEIGQKILLKTGLLPKYQSERLIELKNESFKIVK